MEEFEKFIFLQFERFGYEMKVQIMDGQFLFKHKDKEDYWIVSDGLWAMEHQYELFQELKKEHKNEFPRADKNTSILLLINMELLLKELSLLKFDMLDYKYNFSLNF